MGCGRAIHDAPGRRRGHGRGPRLRSAALPGGPAAVGALLRDLLLPHGAGQQSAADHLRVRRAPGVRAGSRGPAGLAGLARSPRGRERRGCRGPGCTEAGSASGQGRGAESRCHRGWLCAPHLDHVFTGPGPSQLQKPCHNLTVIRPQGPRARAATACPRSALCVAPLPHSYVGASRCTGEPKLVQLSTGVHALSNQISPSG